MGPSVGRLFAALLVAVLTTQLIEARPPSVIESTIAFRKVHIVDPATEDDGLFDSYKLAVFTLFFDQPLYLSGDRNTPFAASPKGVRGKLDGVASLVCGDRTFSSIDPDAEVQVDPKNSSDPFVRAGWPAMPAWTRPKAVRTSGEEVPLHLVPLPHATSPTTHFLSIIERDAFKHDDPANMLAFALVLNYEIEDDAVENAQEDEVRGCELVLPGTGHPSATNYAGEAAVGRTLFKAAPEAHKTFDYVQPQTSGETAMVALETGAGDAAMAGMFSKLEAKFGLSPDMFIDPIASGAMANVISQLHQKFSNWLDSTLSARLSGFFTGVGDTNRPKVLVWEIMDMMAMIKAKMEEMAAKLAALKAIAEAKAKEAKALAEAAKVAAANEKARLAALKDAAADAVDGAADAAAAAKDMAAGAANEAAAAAEEAGAAAAQTGEDSAAVADAEQASKMASSQLAATAGLDDDNPQRRAALDAATSAEKAVKAAEDVKAADQARADASAAVAKARADAAAALADAAEAEEAGLEMDKAAFAAGVDVRGNGTGTLPLRHGNRTGKLGRNAYPTRENTGKPRESHLVPSSIGVGEAAVGTPVEDAAVGAGNSGGGGSGMGGGSDGSSGIGGSGDSSSGSSSSIGGNGGGSIGSSSPGGGVPESAPNVEDPVLEAAALVEVKATAAADASAQQHVARVRAAVHGSARAARALADQAAVAAQRASDAVKHYPRHAMVGPRRHDTLETWLTRAVGRTKKYGGRATGEVLLEVGAFKEEGAFSMAEKMEEALPPSENLGAIQKKMVEQMSHSLTTEMSKKVTTMVAAELNDILSPSLIEKLNAEVAEKASEQVWSSVESSVATSVSYAVSTSLLRILPVTLTSSMNDVMTNTLTRALTHSLAPTLAHTLARSPESNYYCYYCRTKKTYCDKCGAAADPGLDRKKFALLHVSASYYSDYYAEYYTGNPHPHP